jgi:hypothetical protein
MNRVIASFTVIKHFLNLKDNEPLGFALLIIWYWKSISLIDYIYYNVEH